MNHNLVRSAVAVLAIFATLGVLAGIERIGNGLMGSVDAAGSVKRNEAAATSSATFADRQPNRSRNRHEPQLCSLRRRRAGRLRQARCARCARETRALRTS